MATCAPSPSLAPYLVPCCATIYAAPCSSGCTSRGPRLLELSAWYRFAPRPVAVARGNEKGRVERAIRFVRERFFAARRFTDLTDLNAQALAWCAGEAAARPCPEDRSRTVRECFEAERAHLLALPEEPFPAEERVIVRTHKTPYARFDLNDYSVPHTHVRRTLEVLATVKTVRILDGRTIIAIHPRSFDRAAQIEDPAHIRALQAHKRPADRVPAAGAVRRGCRRAHRLPLPARRSTRAPLPRAALEPHPRTRPFTPARHLKRHLRRSAVLNPASPERGTRTHAAHSEQSASQPQKSALLRHRQQYRTP